MTNYTVILAVIHVATLQSLLRDGEKMETGGANRNKPLRFLVFTVSGPPLSASCALSHLILTML